MTDVGKCKIIMLIEKNIYFLQNFGNAYVFLYVYM